MNDYELRNKYEELQKLREEITTSTDERYMNYYYKLKEFNYNDTLYGWMFSNDAILNDTLEELSHYQKPYVMELLQIYINELDNIIRKVNL